MYEQDELPFEQCQNPNFQCQNAGNVAIKHNVLDPDTQEVLTSTVLGWLCQACAMSLALNQARLATAHLN